MAVGRELVQQFPDVVLGGAIEQVKEQGPQAVRDVTGIAEIEELRDAIIANDAEGVAAAVFWLGTGRIPGAKVLKKLGPKILKQMGPRGWTPEAIDKAITSGQQVRAVNKATGNPATRYVHPQTGQSVVVDDVTGEVVQVGGPGFKYGPGSGDLP